MILEYSFFGKLDEEWLDLVPSPSSGGARCAGSEDAHSLTPKLSKGGRTLKQSWAKDSARHRTYRQGTESCNQAGAYAC